MALNLVTSTRKSDAANFGFDELMEHNTRYERMEEFTDVCRALWDSAEAGAMLWDHAAGRVSDPKQTFFDHGARIATAFDKTIAGTAAQVADMLEDAFEATGSRGGFMLGHTVSMPADLSAIVNLLIPELQRRGRLRTAHQGRTLRDHLSEG